VVQNGNLLLHLAPPLRDFRTTLGRGFSNTGSNYRVALMPCFGIPPLRETPIFEVSRETALYR
jgi:hypothetical protein